MYHKLETQQATTTTELDENSEVVKAAARIAGVSVQAVLAQYRRMSYLESNTQTHASGFVGISLGRVELPVMNRGVVRKDGWRAATIGPDAITPKLPRGQVAVSVSEDMSREMGSIVDDEAALEQRHQDVATLQEFLGAMPEGENK